MRRGGEVVRPIVDQEESEEHSPKGFAARGYEAGAARLRGEMALPSYLSLQSDL